MITTDCRKNGCLELRTFTNEQERDVGMSGDRLEYLMQERDSTERLIRDSHLYRIGRVPSDLKKVDAEITQIMGA